MELSFAAPVIYWRGPAPFFYARLPADPAEAIARLKRTASYGWGAIPVTAAIGGISFTTSLFPKDGTYLLPLKDAVRRRLGVTVDDVVAVEMTVGARLANPPPEFRERFQSNDDARRRTDFEAPAENRNRPRLVIDPCAEVS